MRGIGAVRLTKYRNTPVIVEGVSYASKKEARRAGELQLLQLAGEITDLVAQPVFPIVINGVKVCKYIADASYKRDGVLIVEDTKSEITRKNPVYRLKNKLMKAVHGIDIKEV